MTAIVDLTGRQFGQWTALQRKGKQYRGSTYWLCLCSCGKERGVNYSNLINGVSKSCGHGMGPYPREGRIRHGAIIWQVYNGGYQRPARRRGLVFELSEDDFVRISSCPCFYCGCAPSQTQVSKSGRESFTYNGVDRFDNSKGYTLSNSVPCCRPCNVSKNKGSAEDFINRCKRVAIRHA